MISLLNVLREERGERNDTDLDMIGKGVLNFDAGRERVPDRDLVGGEKGIFALLRVQALEDRSLSGELRSLRQRTAESLQQRMQTPVPAGPTPAAPAAPAESAQAGGPGLVGRTTIVPDQATNSLVIRTAPPNFSVLQETIEQLDVRPPQVLLEVLIAEVTLDKANQYGINWQLFTQKGIAGDSTRGLGVGVGPRNFSDTLLAGFQGLGARFIRLASVDVRAILRALASQTNVRVLSTPRVLALNNEEARILVGSEVPFVQSTLSGFNAVTRPSAPAFSRTSALDQSPTGKRKTPSSSWPSW